MIKILLSASTEDPYYLLQARMLLVYYNPRSATDTQ